MDINSSSKPFMGFETFWNNLRMAMKMERYIFLISTAAVLFIAYLVYIFSMTKTERSVMEKYLLSFVRDDKFVTTLHVKGREYTVTYKAVKRYKDYADAYYRKYLSKAKWSLIAYVLILPLNFIFYLRAKNQSETKYIRGARLFTPKELNKLVKETDRIGAELPFGKVKMPVEAEVKHTLIIGRPGVGKTVCLSQILEKLIERGNRIIIHDFKGDYLQKFYRPGTDIIFNPLDARSVYWNFFDEIESPIDVDAIGYALIPDAKGAGMDPFWNNAARDVLTGMINYLYRENLKSYSDFYSLSISPSDIIAMKLKGTKGSEAGATTIADPESKQTGSIMSVLTQYTKIFGYMKEDNECYLPLCDNCDEPKKRTRFNLREWLRNPKSGNIFITNYSKLQNTLAPILALMIDLFSRELLSLPENTGLDKESWKKHVYFILDEFGMLQKLQSIVPILTQARSKGGGVFLGIQDLGQIDKTYGKEHRQSIVNACGSSAVFAVADADTAKGLSDKYGEVFMIKSHITQSMGVMENRDGLSINQQEHKEQLILPSEIMSLRDLNCFACFAGYPVVQTELTWKKFEDRNEPFILREGLSYEELMRIEAEFKRREKEEGIRESAKLGAELREMEPMSDTESIRRIEEENNNWDR